MPLRDCYSAVAVCDAVTGTSCLLPCLSLKKTLPHILVCDNAHMPCDVHVIKLCHWSWGSELCSLGGGRGYRVFGHKQWLWYNNPN